MKIEKGVPCPYSGRRDGPQYPFSEMEVGDSFLIPKEMNYINVRYGYFSFVHRRGLDWKFTVRKTPEGHRCWRIR